MKDFSRIIITVVGLLLVGLLSYLSYYYFDRAPSELSSIKTDIQHLNANQNIFRSDINDLKLSVNGILITLALLHNINGKNLLAVVKDKGRSNEDAAKLLSNIIQLSNTKQRENYLKMKGFTSSEINSIIGDKLDHMKIHNNMN